MRIVVPSGGIGAARFLTGLVAEYPGAEITVVGNTADDIQLHGLQVCPDLDTVMYTLGGGIAADRGWGRADETYTVAEELAAYDKDSLWFTLGDRDLATHLIRTQMLAAGYPLSAVTRALCQRWRPGVTLLPMTDERVETRVRAVLDGSPAFLHFQEWWVRHGASLPAEEFRFVGVDEAHPAPGVLEAFREAELIIIPPSNPVVSLGPILAVPGLRQALIDAAAPVVGVSPIVGGHPVRGMADACLTALGVEVSAAGVASHYGGGTGGGLLDAWIVQSGDEDADFPDGLPIIPTNTLMTDVGAARALARAAVEAAR